MSSSVVILFSTCCQDKLLVYDDGVVRYSVVFAHLSEFFDSPSSYHWGEGERVSIRKMIVMEPEDLRDLKESGPNCKQ